jgi:hypothetical protein
MQGTAMPISHERAGRLDWTARIENSMPNKVMSRQTIVNRRASIKSVSFDGTQIALRRLNRL